MHKLILTILSAAIVFVSCSDSVNNKIDIILDTDANNELDDQHAIAYLLLNQEVFNIYGITTNVTIGGGIKAQTDEVERVAALVNQKVSIFPGATEDFETILPDIAKPDFDGYQSVDFIIESARSHSTKNKLTVAPIGKLTNIALALAKAPDIADKMRIVWLGSNYPDPGEHNLVHDIQSMNYILDCPVDFEIVTVRYGQPSGTDAVKISIDEVRNKISGRGPRALSPVEGRHGGTFECFGDYSYDLFDHISKDDLGRRSLFDLCTVAVIKNPSWCESHMIPAPIMVDEKFIERPDNSRMITILENFDSDAIINDFIATLGK